MRIIDIIHKKRSGLVLTKEEIEFVVKGCAAGEIPDYQLSALLMAIWFKSMDYRETADLTKAMAESGAQIDLSGIKGIKVDKHSTGGVADTTTFVAVPLAAACGCVIAKMSGRGLGHTGGTIDKLESIPGYNPNQSIDNLKKIVKKCGFAIISQTENIVPADKKLYALRDVTDTVDNISLIAASIMSKKIASGSDGIVLDVKTGSGAFMKSLDESKKLAELMVNIGRTLNKKMIAVVTDMNQPLGTAIGNALEIKEAIEILKGERQGDLKDLSILLASKMLKLSGKFKSDEKAFEAINKAIEDGSAVQAFGKMIEAQGGNKKIIDNTDLLPKAEKEIGINAESEGYLSEINTSQIGISAMLLGAGRNRKEDKIDHGVGIWMKKRIGDFVEKDETLAVFYINDGKNIEASIRNFREAVKISNKKPKKTTLVYKVYE